MLNFDGDDYLYRYKCAPYEACCVTRKAKQPLEECEGREFRVLVSFAYADFPIDLPKGMKSNVVANLKKRANDVSLYDVV